MNQPPKKPVSTAQKPSQQEKRAQALRQNLLKRKRQTRDRQDSQEN